MMTTIPILTEISARHIHLCQEHLDQLFGKGYKLNKIRSLSQRGQFTCQEQITIQSDKAKIEQVRVVGPLRPRTQLEISKTDAIKLDINPPLRKSGDLDNSAGCTLIGPKGKIEFKEGVIIAWRHIHVSPEFAKKHGLSNDKYVSVKINNDDRSLVFDKVFVRIDPKSTTPIFCVDTDEGNAAGINQKTMGELIIER